MNELKAPKKVAKRKKCEKEKAPCQSNALMEVFEKHSAASTCYSGSDEELCIGGFVLKISAAMG